MHLHWKIFRGGTPENGVTAQENAAIELTPTKSIIIDKGGNYEIPGGNYAGNITINLTDITETVNITINGNIKPTNADPFIHVTNAGVVNVEMGGHEFDGTAKKHFMYIYNPTADVTVSNGKFKASSFHPFMMGSGALTVNDVEMETGTYCIVAGGSSNVTVNRGRYTFSNSTGYPAVFVCNGGSMTLNDVTATSTEAVLSASNSTVVVNGGNFKTTGTRSCFSCNAANLTINKGITTDGTFASEGASCINNKWGLVEINGGTITSDADCTIENRGSLRMNKGTVASTNPDAVVIDCTGNYGGTWINGGTIKGGEDGILLKDLGSFGVTLTQATFEGNTNDIHLGDDQTAHFEMPGCNVTVEALYQGGNVDIDNPSGGGSSDVVAGIAAVALTGAAVWSIYEAGTGIYRVLNMPGVPMPSNRAGLATLIWEKAGCPEPQTVKSFSDIDDADLHLRQAASWMEEQGLMDDVKENEFRPYRYVTKLQTCLVWDKAKEESLIS